MTSVLYRAPALRVVQPIGTFWVTVIPARILLIAATPDPLRAIVDKPGATSEREWSTGLRLMGSQRGLSAAKLKQIGDYVDVLDASFPNSIIVAANSALGEDSEELTDANNWRIEHDGDHATIVIPNEPRQASIVDGQHRLLGFFHSKIDTRRDFQLLCTVFFEMPLPVQATLFATINTKQTPVRRSMALNLFGYNVDDESDEHWSPTKLAVFIARRLNFKEDSPLRGKIKMEALDAPPSSRLPGASRALSLAAVVDGVVLLISRSPSDDANILKSARSLRRKRRRDLPDDNAPLRLWYTMEADASLYECIRLFCDACYEELWKVAEPGSMIVRAVGLRGLFSFFHAASSKYGLPRTPPKSDSERAHVLGSVFGIFRSVLRKASNVDFTSPFFEANDRGRMRITNLLRLLAGHAEIGSMGGDESHYRQLLSSASNAD